MAYGYELEEDEFAGCCGIVVLFDFPDLDAMDKDEKEEAVSDVSTSLTIPGGKVTMVALTDDQLHSGWRHVLRKIGYRRVSRFCNMGGNVVNVYVGQSEKNTPPPYKAKKAKSKR